MSEFTGRHIEITPVEDITDGVIRWGNGFSFGGVPADVLPRLVVGREYMVETRNFSMVTGMAEDNGSWLWRKSDEDLDREHREWQAKVDAEREEQWSKNRERWAAREMALPLSLRRRLARFRDNGGHDFEVSGWGYELVICELAVLYEASGQHDDETVMEYAREHGTSGNQHDYAKALSRRLTDDPADEDTVANSVSALSPLTGDLDYSGTPS